MPKPIFNKGFTMAEYESWKKANQDREKDFIIFLTELCDQALTIAKEDRYLPEHYKVATSICQIPSSFAVTYLALAAFESQFGLAWQDVLLKQFSSNKN